MYCDISASLICQWCLFNSDIFFFACYVGQNLELIWLRNMKSIWYGLIIYWNVWGDGMWLIDYNFRGWGIPVMSWWSVSYCPNGLPWSRAERSFHPPPLCRGQQQGSSWSHPWIFFAPSWGTLVSGKRSSAVKTGPQWFGLPVGGS